MRTKAPLRNASSLKRVDEILLDSDSDSGGDGAGAPAHSSVEEYIPVPPHSDPLGRTYHDGPRTTLIVCPLSVLPTGRHSLRSPYTATCTCASAATTARRATRPACKDCDLVLTTYGTLAREHAKQGSALFQQLFLRVVLDEGHVIRNAGSCVARAACALRAQRRWVLSGTPVQNRLRDLWSLLCFLRLEPFKERAYWQTAVEKPVLRGDPAGVQLLRQLMGEVALRRLKDQLVDGHPLVELPARQVCVQEVTLGDEQRRRYDAMEATSRAGVARLIRQGTVVQSQVFILVLLLRLRQICCHPALVPDRELILPDDDPPPPDGQPNLQMGAEERERLVRALMAVLSSGSEEECPVCFEPLRRAVITACAHVFCRPCMDALLGAAPEAGALCPMCRGPLRADQLVDAPEPPVKQESAEPPPNADQGDFVSSAKIDALMAGLQAMRKEDARCKAVVVSQFTSLLNLLETPLRRDGFAFRRLDGTMSLAQRRRSMAEFSAQGDTAPTVFLLSLRAGGEGINLTAATRVFLLDPAWNPASEEQCFDRCHRLGQTRPVTIVKLVVHNSVEERMLELQEKKRTLMRDAFGLAVQTAKQRRLQFVRDVRTLFNL
ncbi:helicase-like transcription factor [Pollicipes pollicipes]|uniref:helicase-like transcription factor n=1 Tax=Pollicipes pollicipes TaxID=41117 RepID=UPI001884B369|nr:helicase-like transcription factor [Pollicipes pollicipes]